MPAIMLGCVLGTLFLTFWKAIAVLIGLCAAGFWWLWNQVEEIKPEDYEQPDEEEIIEDGEFE